MAGGSAAASGGGPPSFGDLGTDAAAVAVAAALEAETALFKELVPAPATEEPQVVSLEVVSVAVRYAQGAGQRLGGVSSHVLAALCLPAPHVCPHVVNKYALPHVTYAATSRAAVATRPPKLRGLAAPAADLAANTTLPRKRWPGCSAPARDAHNAGAAAAPARCAPRSARPLLARPCVSGALARSRSRRRTLTSRQVEGRLGLLPSRSGLLASSSSSRSSSSSSPQSCCCLSSSRASSSQRLPLVVLPLCRWSACQRKLSCSQRQTSRRR